MYKSRFDLGYSTHRVAIFINNDEHPTVQHAAYTPSQMDELSKLGIPVTAQNTALRLTQGEFSNSWDIPLARRRGTDVADLWQAQRNARKALSEAHALQVKENKFKAHLQEEQNARLIALGQESLTNPKQE